MEPDSVVQARRLQVLAHARERVGHEGGAEQGVVGHVGQHGLVADRVIAQVAKCAKPRLVDGFLRLRVEEVPPLDRLAFQWVVGWRVELVRVFLCHGLPVHLVRLQFFRRRGIDFEVLVRQAGLLLVKGYRRIENGLAVLLGDDAARGEAPAVADGVDIEHDLLLGIAGAQEVGVHRVGQALLLQRAAGRAERLGQHLAAEDPAGFLRAVADEKVFVYLLYLKIGEQCLQVTGHGELPLVCYSAAPLRGSSPLKKMSK